MISKNKQTNIHVHHSNLRRQIWPYLNFQNNSNTLKLQQGKQCCFKGIIKIYHQGTIRIYPCFFLSFRINRGEIEAEFERQVKKLKDAKADTLKQEDLKAQMEDFLQVRNNFVGNLVCVNFSRD